MTRRKKPKHESLNSRKPIKVRMRRLEITRSTGAESGKLEGRSTVKLPRLDSLAVEMET